MTGYVTVSQNYFEIYQFWTTGMTIYAYLYICVLYTFKVTYGKKILPLIFALFVCIAWDPDT